MVDARHSGDLESLDIGGGGEHSSDLAGTVGVQLYGAVGKVPHSTSLDETLSKLSKVQKLTAQDEVGVHLVMVSERVVSESIGTGMYLVLLGVASELDNSLEGRLARFQLGLKLHTNKPVAVDPLEEVGGDIHV